MGSDSGRCSGLGPAKVPGGLWGWGFWLGMGHVGTHSDPALLIQLFANESVPDHVGYAKVKITLINENDNRPIFSQPLYNVSLYENVTVGTSVLTVLVSSHNTARPLSSGATRRILPEESGQSGKRVSPTLQWQWHCCIKASGLFSLGLPWPRQACGKGASLKEDETGPRTLWFSALSMRGTVPGWARHPGSVLEWA